MIMKKIGITIIRNKIIKNNMREKISVLKINLKIGCYSQYLKILMSKYRKINMVKDAILPAKIKKELENKLGELWMSVREELIQGLILLKIKIIQQLKLGVSLMKNKESQINLLLQNMIKLRQSQFQILAA